MSTFFKAYNEFPEQASKAMECLVQIAATRKALFTGEEERSKFVMAIMHGIRDVILTTQGMNDPDCFNGFCRLLSRFRTTAPLNEMAEKPGYLQWIELVAGFSEKAFYSSSSSTTNTCFYLLSFWSRIVQSMTYFQQLGETTVQKLEGISVELTRAYISTYINTVPTRIEEMLDGRLWCVLGRHRARVTELCFIW